MQNKNRNWSEYNKSLVNRGSLTFWVDPKMLKTWKAKPQKHQAGRPYIYSDLDDRLRLEEERAFLNRIETQKEEKLTIVDFHERIHMFGTFSIITNLKEKAPEDIYTEETSRLRF